MGNFKITSYGAAEETTGSKHLIEVGGKKILLDCGMFQGRRKDADKKNHNFGFDPKNLDAVCLSHAHIDHSGLLPRLFKKGYSGKVFCRPATKDLTEILLKDSAHIIEEDFKYAQKKGYNPQFTEAIYNKNDLGKVFKNFEIKNKNTPFFVGDVKIEFFGAGHILGAALTKISFGGESLLFTGDLGREDVPILINAETPDADFILMESTYGGRFHEPVNFSRQSLVKIINEIYEKGGKILIPSFSVERTQEILYYLEESLKQKEIKDLKVFVDSSLSIKVTNIFKNHEECFDKETKKRYKFEKLFENENIFYTKSVAQSKKINEENKPCIIISSSGMCNAGRIKHHLLNNLEDENSCVLIVGYMAKYTLGRDLVEKKKLVKIFGQEKKVKAKIIKLNSFSGHADEKELLTWLGKIKKPKKVILIHGEKEGQAILKKKILKKGLSCEIAKFGKSIEL